MKRIIISAVNFNEGGPLSILKDSLKAFQKIYREKNLEIIVLVHKIHLVEEFVNDFKIIEFPLIKTSWLKRIIFEYYSSKRMSSEFSPYLWIALHDITPNVTCKQVVYCHNPSPFYKLKLKDAYTDPTFFLFCLFYSGLYRINIKKNKFVIVQQQWLREKFESKYNIKTIVSYPFEKIIEHKTTSENVNKTFKFFFPAFPRVAKNFEVLLQAAKLLSFKIDNFEIILSISGSENKYAQKLYKDYGDIDQIKFIGPKTREQVFDIYKDVNCLVFPSKLETWGLPISEFKAFNKPMLLSDLQYAHETLGNYQYVKFFDPNDAEQLSIYMQRLIEGEILFDNNLKIIPSKPFFKNWNELVSFLSTEL